MSTEKPGNTDYTDGPEDNLLHITDKALLNEAEAKGVIMAEHFLLDMELPISIDPFLVQELHKQAFKHLYEWAGKWRVNRPMVGPYLPPAPATVPGLMFQFCDTVKYRYENIKTEEDLVACLAFAHHGLVHIHPFQNGNGRTARLFTNLLALAKGYKSVELYQRKEGEPRKKYLQAIRLADQYDYRALEEMIRQQLRALE